MSGELLIVEKLAAGYGRIPVLFGVDFSIAAGESIGILGHNGMGKTTLLRAVMGHLQATAGQVRFDGQDITRAPTFRRSRLGIGYVPQGRQIFSSLTVLDNLRMGAISVEPSVARSRIDKTLELFPRLKALLDRVGGVLSGGEQQILALARCLCSEPRLLLLDEPSEGIQPSIIEEIAAALRRLADDGRLAIVLVEQNLDFIRKLSRRVLLIRKGRLFQEFETSVLNDQATIDEFVGVAV